MARYDTITGQKHCFNLFTDDAVGGVNGKTLLVMLAITAVFITFSSLGMLCGLWKTLKKFSSVQRLLFFLSCIDLLIGLLVVPLQTVMVYLASRADCILIQLQAFTNVFFPLMEGLVLLLLVFIRYHKIADTKMHKTFANRVFIYAMLFFAVLLSSLLSLWYILNRTIVDTMSHAAFFITAGSITGICLIFIIVMNLKLLNFMKKTARTNSAVNKRSMTNYRKEVTKTILLMSISICVCYLPLVFVFINSGIFIILKSQDALNVIYITVPWSQVILLVNSGVNSLIYTTRTKSIRRYYRNKFTIKKLPIRGESFYSSSIRSVPSVKNIKLQNLNDVKENQLKIGDTRF